MNQTVSSGGLLRQVGFGRALHPSGIPVRRVVWFTVPGWLQPLIRGELTTKRLQSHAYPESRLVLEKSPLALVIALLLVLAGCAGVGVSDSPAPRTQETIDKTFLHVTALAESEEDEYSERAVAFQNLSAAKQTEFLEARNCSCKIETSAFSFGEQQEVYQVKYNDDIYLIYVSVH